MKMLVGLGIILMMLSGCCSLCPPKIETVYIAAPCVPPASVIEPVLITPTLTDKSTSKQIIEAYVLDVNELLSYSEKLKATLNPYYSCGHSNEPK